MMNKAGDGRLANGHLPTRPLGETGLRVTPLGLGLAALGRPGYINLGHDEDLGGDKGVDAMRTHAHQVLDAAWEAGVRYFDAARSYGRAEAFLGAWIEGRGLAPEQLTVGSKWGYTYTAGWQVEAEVHEVKEHSLAVLQRQWQETRSHLGRALDLYQIHSATLDSGVLENGPVLKALAQLKEQGVRVGLSLSGSRQVETLKRAIEVQADGVRLFDCVQATWNLLERSAGPALEAARAEGMGVIVKEALANGRLTERNEDPEFRQRLDLLRSQAERLNASVDALALAGVLARPWADVVLSGAATREHLRSNVTAPGVVWDDQAENTLAGLVELPQTYWQIRADLAWN